jgi:predicted Rossmann-fold nucleotide-binding protein
MSLMMCPRAVLRRSSPASGQDPDVSIPTRAAAQILLTRIGRYPIIPNHEVAGLYRAIEVKTGTGLHYNPGEDAEKMSQPRRAIVGVVGGSSSPLHLSVGWERVLRLARDVGVEVAGLGGVVLTGAEPGEYGRSPSEIGKVHRNAMRAAVDARGLAIAVLPRRPSPAVTWKDGVLLIETVLTSHERNLINGATPDVLIALAGGPGTVSEALIALSLGRPVIYLNSLHVLRAQDQSQVRAILEDVSNENDLDVEAVANQLLEGTDFAVADKAVAAALGSVASLSRLTNYPKLLRGAPAKKLFEDSFRAHGGAG